MNGITHSRTQTAASNDEDGVNNHTSNNNGHNSNNGASRMQAFELDTNDNNDDEIDSLLLETTEAAGGNYKSRVQQVLHHRVTTTTQSSSRDTSELLLTATNNIRGLVRSSIGFASTYRTYCTLCTITMFTIILLNVFSYVMENDLSVNDYEDRNAYHKIDRPRYHPHEPSLGGYQNPGQFDMDAMYYGGNDDAFDMFMEWQKYHNDNALFPTRQNIVIPLTGYIGTPILSLTKVNRDNANGHYWHDPFYSPYSSPFYQRKTLMEEIEYETKLSNVVEQYGLWQQPSTALLNHSNYTTTETATNTTTNTTENDFYKNKLRDEINFYSNLFPTTDHPFSPDFDVFNYRNRDIPGIYFPNYSWHLNTRYVTEFLQQSKQLIHRMKEGIYAEYGMSSSSNDGNDVDTDLQKRREDSFGIHITEYDDSMSSSIDPVTGGRINKKDRNVVLPGAAYINQAGYDGLVRKLLHAIITQDDFYTIVVSAGAHTYRANNMFQTQIMQFQYIMEPVFDKLGIQLISRNMGMDTSTTSIHSLGGGDINGEADIIWYIPDDRPSSSSSDNNTSSGAEPQADGHFDLLHIQSILSGRRMPLLLTPNPGSIMNNTNLTNTVWMGNIQPGYDYVCNPNDDQDIYACKYIHCNNDASTTNDDCKNQYNSVCWVNRSVWNPRDTKQDPNVGYTSNNYQNPNQHKLYSRKLAMLILHALDDALDQWSFEHLGTNAQQQQQSVTLPDSMWHVSDVYHDIREKVRVNAQQGSTACDELLQRITNEICHLEMHVYTEWTPRVMPNIKRLKDLVRGRIADVNDKLYELYEDIDLLPLEWKLPMNETDVHMIAIAVNMSEMHLHMDNHPNPVPITSNKSDDGFKKKPRGMKDDDFSGSDDGFGSGLEDYIINAGNNGNDRQRRLLRANIDDDENDVTDDVTDATQEQDQLPVEIDIQTIDHEQLQIIRHRRMQIPAVSKKAWSVYQVPIGYCDGSSQSRCNRILGNTCLLSNYNHYKGGLIGHGDSGPLQLKIPNIKEGIILVRFDWKYSGQSDAMSLLPDDFEFIYSLSSTIMSVNTTNHSEGTTPAITKSLSKKQFQELGVVMADDLVIHPLMLDQGMGKEEKFSKIVNLDIEIRSPSAGAASTLLLTHLYYA